jgi:hypothetical protein
MSKNMSGHQLAEQIEKLVEDFIASSRSAASAAVERAFAAPGASRRSARPAQRGPCERKISTRRSPDEMAALSERLYDAICSTPGETMTSLAASIGVAAREMLVPSAKLKRAGRIRSVGQKNQTRYFPMLKSTSKSS